VVERGAVVGAQGYRAMPAACWSGRRLNLAPVS
jgi:hypothetical protein